MLGDSGLQEYTYKNIEDKKIVNFDVTNGWLGITDKYWATTVIPDAKAKVDARFLATTTGTVKTYQADYLGTALTPEHVDLLKRCDCREVTVLFDGDVAGLAAPGKAAAALFPSGLTGKVALLPAEIERLKLMAP